MYIYIYIYAVIYLENPRNSIAALLCQKAIFSMLRRNARSDMVIIFCAIVRHSYVWTMLGLKGKDVHLNWFDVLEPGFGVYFSQKKQLMETSPKVVIPKHYGVISQHDGVISRNHDRIHFPLFLLLMDLQSP